MTITTPGEIMTPKERLELILAGKIPDQPPHFELTFQLADKIFSMDLKSVENRNYSSEQAKEIALRSFHTDLQLRLIEKFNYCAVEPYNSLAGISELKIAVGSKALVSAYDWDGIFWMPDGNQIMYFIEKMYEHPEEMHAEARRKCEQAKLRVRKQSDAGCDFYILAYDFGFNSGPFISPSQFREFIIPYLTELVQTIHDLGKKAILHSDGNIDSLLDDIYATGIDGYQSIDPQGNMDIKKVRERYPDWILMGNVNSGMLQFMDEEKIRSSVQYCMQYGGVGKRYIFSTSNCIFEGMPAESYYIMLNEYHKIINEINEK